MAYKYSFADNAIYSADDINEITQRLVTQGIEDSFVNEVPYNVSRFNEQGMLLYTEGVVPESCFTLKVVPAGEDKILINPGKAFFADGAVIEIESGGETLSFVKGAKNFVYLKNDLLNENICFPACTSEEPSGDFVMLAEIDENGVISDKRIYTKGKLPGYRSLSGEIVNLKGKVSVTYSTSGSGFGSKTFDIGDNNFRYIFTVIWPNDDEYGAMGLYDIENDMYMSCHSREPFYNSTAASGSVHLDCIYVHCTDSGSTRDYITFSLADGKLTVDFNRHSSFSQKYKPGTTEDMDINLILF